jgi:replicative DNA helicase
MSQPLPNALEVERTLLGTFLIDNVSLAEAKSSLPVSAFYGSHHREIYSAMVAMSDIGRVVDPITLVDTLNNRGSLSKIGGEEYIAELSENISSKQSVPEYMRIISEKYMLRNVIETCSKIAAGCYDDTAQIQKVLAQVEQLGAKISEDCDKAGVTHKKAGNVLRIEDVKERVYKYHREGFVNVGVTPCSYWPEFSLHYKPAKRMLNVWTGIPGHGKSEFMDALMMNLALEQNWKFGVFSPENFPWELYVQKLSEKLLGKKFFGQTQEDELKPAIEFMNDHFFLLDPDEDNINVDSLMALNLEAVKKYKIDSVVWDPWNELSPNLRGTERETDYIGRELGRIRRHARRHGYLMNIIAHPTKMQRDLKTGKYLVPTLYDINGSSNWYNKADNGFTVYRNFDTKIIDVHIQKIKFKIHGKVGVVQFRYDYNSGMFYELEDTDSFTQESTPVKKGLK